jgi:putative ABC transport system permease protein
MRSWRPALRIARREALRHRARSLVVVAMIGLPVAGIVATDVVLRTQAVSPREGMARQLGAADALVSTNYGPVRLAQTPDGEGFVEIGRLAGGQRTAADARAALGPGARMRTYLTDALWVRTRVGAAQIEGTEVDLRDPMTRGLFGVVRGRLPAGPAEVAISESLASRGFPLGARLDVVDGPAPTVVGVASSPREKDTSFAVALPGELGVRRGGGDLRQLLVAQPGGVSWRDVQALNRLGMVVVSRRVFEHPPPESAVNAAARASGAGGSASEAGLLALVVAMALLEVVLLAGPAFAVGARQRRHMLALMAAGGAEPRDLRRTVLALGVVLGGAGAVAGVAAGIAAARIAVPTLEGASQTPFGPFEVAPLDLLAIAGFGLASAVLAAAVPAWLAARQDPVAVLAGRRGEGSPGRRSPVAGLALLVAGTTAAVAGARMPAGAAVIAVGTLLSVLGMVLLIPLVVAALGRTARRLPLPLRFAIRDAARNRTRTAPAVAAVAATVVGVTALGIASASDSTERQRTYTPAGPPGAAVVTGVDGLPADAERVVRRMLPGATVRTIQGVPDHPSLRFSGTTGSRGWLQSLGTAVLVASGGTADLGVGLPPSSARRADAVLARGGAVVLDPGRPGAGATTVRTRRAHARVPAVFVDTPGFDSRAQALIAPALADRLGLEVRPAALLATGIEIGERRENDLRESLAAVSPELYAVVERGLEDDDQALILLALGVAGAVLMLGGTLTATFLALSDARPDLATLAAVGAAPRSRRLIAAAYAGTIGLVGALLGAAIGFVPGVAAAYSNTGSVVDVPWLLIATVVIALPALAAATVGLTARSRLPMVSRLG